MVDEMTSLDKNEACDLLELSSGRKPIGRKRVFKKKMNEKGKVEKYKSQLVAKGYSQDNKLLKVPIPVGVKLSVGQCPKTHEEEDDMSHFPYTSPDDSLMYAMVFTRLDIAHVVGVLSKFMSKPGKKHWITMKWIFRHLCDTNDYGLCYQGRSGLDKFLDVCGFVDADWAGDLDKRRSARGYVFNLFGGAVSWMRKR
eukprot:PITA_33410